MKMKRTDPAREKFIAAALSDDSGRCIENAFDPDVAFLICEKVNGKGGALRRRCGNDKCVAPRHLYWAKAGG